MKNVKTVLILAFFALAMAVPVLKTSMAHATEVNLLCSYEIQIKSDETETGNSNCDLALTKQVKVNDGEYVDADTADTAAPAQVGDTVTWQIMVANNSDDDRTPFGIVTVHDVLPAGVTLSEANPSTGTYDGETGDWTFTLGQNLPATLTLTSTVTQAGLIKNTATLTDYDPNNCEGKCGDPPYFDNENDNNTNDAFVNVAAVPVVTPAPVVPTPAAPTLVNTGVNPLAAMLAAFGIATATVLVFNYDKVKAELVKFAKARN